ncbi:sensor domain-containing protein [Actinospica durhamensis]|uniref:histidine kinase n=1 Tax=Actinospica durhamensis TaxID=1508375 RepID=A0A941IMJ6_9ACTN|nr:histidine kinase [Actinospica durhamensis]MBR7832934.1 sensor domain-containing protein [Actinospica durhamensis]
MKAAIRQAAHATVQLARTVGLAFFSLIFVTVLIIAAVGTIALVGAALLPETVLLIRRLAGAKRRMVSGWTGREIPEAYLPITGPLRERLRTSVRDTCTYADLRWMGLHYGYGLFGLAAVPLWLLGLPLDGLWCGLLRQRALVLPLITRLADLDARWSTALLDPPPKARLAERVTVLTETRANAVAAHGVELRRIERDLHDGAQAQLVSLSMRIGLARRAYERDPEAGRKLLDEAQDQAQQALAQLRHVVRGIHPPILTDRGLLGAVRALAASSGLDVAFEVEGFSPDSPRAPAAVEAAAYFVVAESLTNAAKYSGSDHAELTLARTAKGLRVVVRDEGRGGAVDPAGRIAEAAASGAPAAGAAQQAGAERIGGSGLVGMRRRVAALDGSFKVSSPLGGPTVIEVELPCVW